MRSVVRFALPGCFSALIAVTGVHAQFIAIPQSVSANPAPPAFSAIADNAPMPGFAAMESRIPLADLDAPDGLPQPPESDSNEASRVQPLVEKHVSPPRDFNQNIYFRNKLEFALDGGWLPINVPFPFDVFEGDAYDLYPLRYTLVPIVVSLRWHLSDIWGPPVLRGNWDMTFSLSATAIPRGAETHYYSYDMGIRRNFIPHRWHAAPYWDIRLGMGETNAKGPEGVHYAQGQDFTFTANMGAGARYNFNPRYTISAGLNYMHISNAGLSEPKVPNYGINVYGPMFGLDIMVHGRPRHSE